MVYLHAVLGEEVGHEALNVAFSDLVELAAQFDGDFRDSPFGIAQLDDGGSGGVDDPNQFR